VPVAPTIDNRLAGRQTLVYVPGTVRRAS